MQVYYEGLHSVNFWDPKTDPQFDSGNNPWKNSWTDFHLIPSSRPVISPPPVKKSSIEVIGANKLIDLTEVPRGFPTYGNRTGTLEFYIDNSDPNYDWASIYHEIKRYFHGRWLRMYLDDEASSYYEGRFDIKDWKNGKNISQIIIDYDLDPFALSMFSTLEEWLWDPFDFLTMDIPSKHELFSNLEVPSGETSSSVCYSSDVVGSMPVIPAFYVADSDENGMSVQVYNSYNEKWSHVITVYNNIDSPTGYVDPLITFSTPTPGSSTWIFFSGVGKLSIDFRPGRL
ncbi:MAG: hypothetical protein IKU36_01740 [Bacteroidales bacterium]|nr:hypothetical protein [Clostridiales bacterium]MBR5298952.1 hypothetical protein [Bacteroidales bacterium]